MAAGLWSHRRALAVVLAGVAAEPRTGPGSEPLDVRNNLWMPGYFNDESLIRSVHRGRVVGLGGARALLMQAAHPVAFAGFFMSTGTLDDPYARLRRTARALGTVLFRERDDSDRVAATVRRVHGRARGTLPKTAGSFPAGTPWAADDPALQLWIIATLADSGALIYTRYVGGLTRRERDALAGLARGRGLVWPQRG